MSDEDTNRRLAEVDELATKAEEERERFNSARERLQEVRSRLMELGDTLCKNDTITPGELNEVKRNIERGDYGKAREMLLDAVEDEALEFSDDDKNVFANEFAGAWAQMEADIEDVRSALTQFKIEHGLGEEDMVDYLYGANSGLNKGDIRQVFDAFAEVRSRGLSPRQMARVLAAYEHDLNIEPTVAVLEAIKEQADA